MPQAMQAAVFGLAIPSDFGGQLDGSKGSVNSFVVLDFAAPVRKERDAPQGPRSAGTGLRSARREGEAVRRGVSF